MTTPGTDVTTLAVPERVHATISGLAQRTTELLLRAREIEVVDELTNNQAATIEAELKQMRLDAEAARVRETTPYHTVKQLIIDTFKPVQTAIAEAEMTVKEKTNAWYMLKVEAKRKEDERKLRETERKNIRAAAAAEKKGLEPPIPEIPMVTIAEPPRTIHTEAGRVTKRLVWKYEIVDEGAIPREWLKVNEQAVGAAVRGGIRSIPGVKIYQAVQ